MKIKKIRIKNYRLLRDVSLSLTDTSTVIVGRNNTGKTSLTEVFRSFFSGKSRLKYEDFSVAAHQEFFNAKKAYDKGAAEECIRKLIPSIKLEILVDYTDDKLNYGVLSNFILDLNEDQYETIILVSYRLKNGGIKKFFEDLDPGDLGEYSRELKDRIANYFEIKSVAIDPCNSQNQIDVELSKINTLFLTDFINAQRGLDDETYNEKDVLGKTLGNIFKSASLESAPDDFKAKSDGINAVVKELQETVDDEFKIKMNEFLPSMSLFGYPGLNDTGLSARTELSVKSLLEHNTRIFYEKNEQLVLPETYNGLGFRNLIYLLFYFYEFFLKYQSAEEEPKGHIIFIEEPEAHLHPQMQETFIRQLDAIVHRFGKNLKAGTIWPVQCIVTTHSTHLANEVDFEKIRYFLSKDGNGTRVKDLSEFSGTDSIKSDRDFLHKYLNLTKCDLFFADKAILVEGVTERLLMSEMVSKTDIGHDTKLRSNYLTIVEVGGAYVHRFFKFLDFLELRTLVITDLDSVKNEKCTDKNGNPITRAKKCPVNEGKHSSNAGISSWFGNQSLMTLNEIFAKETSDKVISQRRIAFQVPENGSKACGRSFEDAFMLANPKLFQISEKERTSLEKIAYSKAQEISDSSKTDFAIKYAIDQSDWEVPKYIEEGLIWLAREPCSSEGSSNGGTE